MKRIKNINYLPNKNTTTPDCGDTTHFSVSPRHPLSIYKAAYSATYAGCLLYSTHVMYSLMNKSICVTKQVLYRPDQLISGAKFVGAVELILRGKRL